MAADTGISWSDSTFNPWIGCTKVSPACDHCYAERLMEHRMHRVKWGAGMPRARTSPSNWKTPLYWEKQHNAFMLAHGRRQRVFCASLADVFDNEVPSQWRTDLFRLIADTPHLDWLLLTKRIGNARDMIEEAVDSNDLPVWPWSHVWLGSTVVNQEEADRDVPKLLATPAAVRFLSIEPMLGPVNLVRVQMRLRPANFDGPEVNGYTAPLEAPCGVDWVIAGDESGPHARPSDLDWYRSLKDQCQAAGVAFHMKQICERGNPTLMELWPSELQVQGFPAAA